MHEQSIDLQQAQPLKAEWVQSPGMLMPNPYVLQKTRPENDGRMENGTMQDVLLRLVRRERRCNLLQLRDRLLWCAGFDWRVCAVDCCFNFFDATNPVDRR